MLHAGLHDLYFRWISAKAIWCFWLNLCLLGLIVQLKKTSKPSPRKINRNSKREVDFKSPIFLKGKDETKLDFPDRCMCVVGGGRGRGQTKNFLFGRGMDIFRDNTFSSWHNQRRMLCYITCLLCLICIGGCLQLYMYVTVHDYEQCRLQLFQVNYALCCCVNTGSGLPTKDSM